MLYLYDKLGKRIGYIKAGIVSICFDNNGNRIGKIGQNGNYLYLCNNNDKLLAIFNGRNTNDSHNNYIGGGNLLYNILYPALKTIR